MEFCQWLSLYSSNNITFYIIIKMILMTLNKFKVINCTFISAKHFVTDISLRSAECEWFLISNGLFFNKSVVSYAEQFNKLRLTQCQRILVFSLCCMVYAYPFKHSLSWFLFDLIISAISINLIK